MHNCYIFGHKNPDADSVCAAIAYQNYKRAKGETRYVAARCGSSNARIDAIFSRFDVDLPVLIGDITPRIRDAMTKNVFSVTPHHTCSEVLEIMDSEGIRALPVENDSGELKGLISIFDLGDFFTPQGRIDHQVKLRVRFIRIARRQY